MSKAHHYISKVYLRNFCIPQRRNMVFSYTVKNQKIEEKSIKRLFTEDNRHTIYDNDGTQDNFIEEHHDAEYENSFRKWVGSLIKKENGLLNGQLKKESDKYVSFVIGRSQRLDKVEYSPPFDLNYIISNLAKFFNLPGASNLDEKDICIARKGISFFTNEMGKLKELESKLNDQDPKATVLKDLILKIAKVLRNNKVKAAVKSLCIDQNESLCSDFPTKNTLKAELEKTPDDVLLYMYEELKEIITILFTLSDLLSGNSSLGDIIDRSQESSKSLAENELFSDTAYLHVLAANFIKSVRFIDRIRNFRLTLSTCHMYLISTSSNLITSDYLCAGAGYTNKSGPTVILIAITKNLLLAFWSGSQAEGVKLIENHSKELENIYMKTVFDNAKNHVISSIECTLKNLVKQQAS